MLPPTVAFIHIPLLASLWLAAYAYLLIVIPPLIVLIHPIAIRAPPLVGVLLALYLGLLIFLRQTK